MRILILLVLICTASLGCFCQAVKNYDIKDIRALNDVAEKWERYWNIHIVDSLATLFATDIDFVTKSGTWFKGKEATVNHHRKNHETIFKTSTWTMDSVA